jgi:DnaJ-class molecular chaperone
MRVVMCSLCNGDKVDAMGSRCIDCQGLGYFEHWKQYRTVIEIETELMEVETILAEETSEECKVYWRFQETQLKDELRTARLNSEGRRNGYLFD